MGEFMRTLKKHICVEMARPAECSHQLQLWAGVLFVLLLLSRTDAQDLTEDASTEEQKALIDMLLVAGVEAPCELEPCVQKCKNMSTSGTVRYTKTVCAPDEACVLNRVKCIESIQAEQGRLDAKLVRKLSEYKGFR